MPFTTTKKTNPHELVATLKDALVKYISERSSGDQKASSDKKSIRIEKNISSIYIKLYGAEKSSDEVAQICLEILKQDVLEHLIKIMPFLAHESRLEITDVVCAVIDNKIALQSPAIDYVADKPNETLFELIRLYFDPTLALNIGIIMRMLIKSEKLSRLILLSEHFWKFFELICMPNFEVSSDSFLTLKDLCFIQKKAFEDFLQSNYDQFIATIQRLLNQEVYLNNRQIVAFLTQLSMEDKSFTFIDRFVNDVTNLKLIMKLMVNKNKSIQLESCNLFKVFIAYPNKSEKIMSILLANKLKLASYYENFLSLIENDPETQEEINYIVELIRNDFKNLK